MKVLLKAILFIFVSCSAFAQTRPSGEIRRPVVQSQTQARSSSTTVPSVQAPVESAKSSPSAPGTTIASCPRETITSMLDSYCSNNICADSSLMYAVLAGAGISTGGDCRLIIFEEISARLSYNYNALVLECNAMNKNYTDAIEEWAVRYAELEDQLGKAEKKKGTATAVAIGTGTLAVGSGIYNIIQNREKKDLREANKELSEKASDDLKVKIEQCQKLGKDYDMISGECVDKIKIDIKNN